MCLHVCDGLTLTVCCATGERGRGKGSGQREGHAGEREMGPAPAD